MSIRTPSYRFHKARSCAVVTINGKDHYLGEYDTPESWEKYHRLVAEWFATRDLPPIPAEPVAAPLTVEELLLAYWRYVQQYYVKDGKPTSEQDTIRQALRFVRKLYAATPAAEFSTLALKAIRQAMINHPVTRKVKVRDPKTGKVVRDPKTGKPRTEVKVYHNGLARRHINKQVGRIKRMFGWAVEENLVPVEVHQALARVKGLRKDKTAAREKSDVRPVPEAHVQAVMPRVPPTIQTMIAVQRLCGGRPQDLVEMKPKDIDRSSPIWEFRPGRHKSEHRGRGRIVFLGPRAQALLQPYLENLRPDEYVFSPIRAENARLTALRQERGLPVGKPSRDRGKWSLRDHYDVASYRRAIRRACKKVGIPIWFPLQLRHSAGTAIRQRFGLEASQAVLGHAELGVTQVYAEVDREAARRVMAEMG